MFWRSVGVTMSMMRPMGGAQQGGDEASLAVEDDNRLEAIFIVIGVEQAELLAAMLPAKMRTKVFALEVRISGKWGSNRGKCRPL